MFCLIAQVNTHQCFGFALHKHWEIRKLENVVVNGRDNSHVIELLTAVRVTFRCELVLGCSGWLHRCLVAS